MATARWASTMRAPLPPIPLSPARERRRAGLEVAIFDNGVCRIARRSTLAHSGRSLSLVSQSRPWTARSRCCRCVQGYGRTSHARSHRHGTSSLFAALMVKTGVVLGECHRRHRHQEVQVPEHDRPGGEGDGAGRDGRAHRAGQLAPAVQRWLYRHPEYQLHFTPTSASWLNHVERVSADLTQKQLRRGVFRSVAALERAALN